MRPIVAAAVLLGLAWSALTFGRSDDAEPVFQNRPLSLWLEILRGGRDQPGRLIAPHILGCPGGLPAVWYGPIQGRRAALLVAELIGPVKSAKVLPAAVSALRNDPADLIREGAARAVGRMCVKAKAENQKIELARDALIVALRSDRSGAVREAAASALARLDVDALPAVAALAAALGDQHLGTRSAAADALRRLGKDARDALPELQAVVRDQKGNLLTRLQAALALGRMGGPESVTPLAEILAAPTSPPELRKAAADALGMVGNDAAAAVAILAKVLIEPSSSTELRRSVAAALDQLGPQALPALASLKKAIKDEDRFVRCQAMHTMGRMGSELGSEGRAVVGLLLQGLGDGVAEVRVAAIEALSALGPKGLGADSTAVRQRLMDAARDSQKAVREAAQDALKRIAAQ